MDSRFSCAVFFAASVRFLLALFSAWQIGTRRIGNGRAHQQRQVAAPFIPLHLLYIPLLLALISSEPLRSQSADPSLYIPPEVSVQVGLGNNALMAFTGHEYFGPPVQFQDRIVFESATWEDSLDLLPMIFFDRGSSIIPERYQQQASARGAADYSERRPPNQYQIISAKFWEILDIIGDRMRREPAKRIRLEPGYSSEVDESPTVARERAESVRDYLTGIWGIEGSRIAILPARLLADTTENVFVQEEARRVLIEGDGDLISRPIQFDVRSLQRWDFFTFIFTIRPNATPDQVSEIEIALLQKDEVINRTRFQGNPDSILYRVGAFWIGMIRQEEPLIVEVSVIGPDGSIRKAEPITMPIEIEETEVRPATADRQGPGNSIILATIPFFAEGKTSIARWQEPIIRRKLVAIQERLRIMPRLNDSISFIASGDGSEDPEMNDVELAVNVAEQKRLNEMREIIDLKSAAGRPLVIMPYTKKADNELLNQAQKAFTGIEEGSEKAQINRRLSELRVRKLELTSLENVDTLLKERAASLLPALGRITDSTITLYSQLEHQVADPRMRDRNQAQYLSIDPFPENRFYHRNVQVVLWRESGLK